MSPDRPLVLGIHATHDASVALVDPRGIRFAVQEERITRIKHHYGFPAKALDQAFESTGLRPADVDAVALAGAGFLEFVPRNATYVGPDGRTGRADRELVRRRGIRGALRHAFARSDDVESRIRAAWGEFADRHLFYHLDRLRSLGLFDKPWFVVDHHRAHASGAFRLSGLPSAVVVTADGKGDGLSGTISRGNPDGSLTLLRASPSAGSLGLFYQAVTEALGFVPVDSEYKTMGLAALGKDDGTANPFAGTVRVEDGVLHAAIEWKFRKYNDVHPTRKLPNPMGSVTQATEYARLAEAFSHEQFSWYAQSHFEEVLVAYLRDAMRIAGETRIAASGGVMLNVKANSLARDLLRPSGFFVFPDSGDSGLAAGAALEALFAMGALPKPLPLASPYVGHSWSEDQIRGAFDAHPAAASLRAQPLTIELLARELAMGRVVGTFQGRLEMGPRALGARSVLADPRSVEVKDKINLILKGREWFVPFAPALLPDEASWCWDGPSDYPYMTFAVRASERALKTIPAVVHVDGTMRPQVVREEANPWFASLLREFRRLTGVGVLINTSFNRHGLPIVGSPHDALDHLAHGWVEALALGPLYVTREMPA